MKQGRKCTNCGENMAFLGGRQIQLGQTGFLLGHMSNLMAGALDVELWECPVCGKLDFFRQGSAASWGDDDYEEGHIAQTVCPKCGTKHDLDDPKCPGCGLKNPNYS